MVDNFPFSINFESKKMVNISVLLKNSQSS